MDATDENALRTLGLRNFDVAVVTIGEDIQSSIMTTLLMKELGVRYIIAKANNELHAKVLKKIGADRVVLPEKDMGIRVAHNIVSSSILDYIELSSEYSIIEIKVLDEWDNKPLRQLKLRSKYGVNVMAIKRDDEINMTPSAEDLIKKDDIIVAIGTCSELGNLEGLIVKYS